MSSFEEKQCLSFVNNIRRISSKVEWMHACILSLQLCSTLCDPMDCSPPGSSVYQILQARILGRAAILSSRGSSITRDQTSISCISITAGGIFIHWATLEAHRVNVWHQLPTHLFLYKAANLAQAGINS